MSVPGKPFQPNLIFESKTKAYPSEALFRYSTPGSAPGLPTSIGLGWKDLPRTSTLAYSTPLYATKKIKCNESSSTSIYFSKQISPCKKLGRGGEKCTIIGIYTGNLLVDVVVVVIASKWPFEARRKILHKLHLQVIWRYRVTCSLDGKCRFKVCQIFKFVE